MKVNTKTVINQHLFEEAATEVFAVPVCYLVYWKTLLKHSVVLSHFYYSLKFFILCSCLYLLCNIHSVLFLCRIKSIFNVVSFWSINVNTYWLSLSVRHVRFHVLSATWYNNSDAQGSITKNTGWITSPPVCWKGRENVVSYWERKVTFLTH